MSNKNKQEESLDDILNLDDALLIEKLYNEGNPSVRTIACPHKGVKIVSLEEAEKYEDLPLTRGDKEKTYKQWLEESPLEESEIKDWFVKEDFTNTNIDSKDNASSFYRTEYYSMNDDYLQTLDLLEECDVECIVHYEENEAGILKKAKDDSDYYKKEIKATVKHLQEFIPQAYDSSILDKIEFIVRDNEQRFAAYMVYLGDEQRTIIEWNNEEQIDYDQFMKFKSEYKTVLFALKDYKGPKRK
jgi:hypothetical protein